MKKSIFFIHYSLLVAALLLSSCSSKEVINGNKCEISGAGARVPEPFYLMAFDSYQTSSGNIVNYDDTGTKNGVIKLQQKKIDFAGSDEFLAEEAMAKMNPVIHVPTCMAAVVFSYNLPGVKKLNLSGDVVADIYARKITSWDDARIKALNPRVKLPAKNIIPIFRSDASCINFLLTSYLSAVSNEWKSNYGITRSLASLSGCDSNCNADVATTLESTPYSFGYLGYEYASTLKMPIARMKNANGELITPNAESIVASAEGDVPIDTCTILANSTVKGAYPITYFTWLVVYKEQNYNNRTEKQARATVELLQYMLSDSIQRSATDINFAPLPQSIIEKSQNRLRKITYNGKPIILYRRH